MGTHASLRSVTWRGERSEEVLIDTAVKAGVY